MRSHVPCIMPCTYKPAIMWYDNTSYRIHTRVFQDTCLEWMLEGYKMLCRISFNLVNNSEESAIYISSIYHVYSFKRWQYNWIHWQFFLLLNSVTFLRWISRSDPCKMLAVRLQLVLPNIINVDQFWYLTEHYIGQNIRILEDVNYHVIAAPCVRSVGCVFALFYTCVDYSEHPWNLSFL